MSNVKLFARIIRTDGSRTYAAPVYSANRRLRPGYANVAGKPENHPEAIYYLRFTENGKRVWKNVGSDAIAATNAVAIQEHALRGVKLGVSRPAAVTELKPPVELVPPSEDDSDRILWKDAVRKYMLEIEKRRSRRTAIIYQSALNEFAAASPVTYLDEITRDHLLKLDSYVQEKKNSARTAYGHMVSVGTFLKYFGIDKVLKKNDLPKFTKKMATSYSADELCSLFSTASPDDRLLFEFFVGSGFRDQEVMRFHVRDIDFKSRLMNVRAKPEFGWQPKDREERAVPISDDLIEKLRDYVSAYPEKKLLSGTEMGKPDSHMLRRLKQTAFRAGLNSSGLVCFAFEFAAAGGPAAVALSCVFGHMKRRHSSHNWRTTRSGGVSQGRAFFARRVAGEAP